MRKHKVKYTDEPMGEVRIVKDFLPNPEELVLKAETVKVTLSLTKASVEYFKDLAKKQHTPYQKMIRALIDQYTLHFEKKSAHRHR